MSKKLTALLAIVVLLAVALFWFKDSFRKHEIAEMLPATTLLFFEQRQGSEAYERFSNSLLGKKVAGINWSALAAGWQLEPMQEQQLLEGVDGLRKFFSSRVAHELFGSDVALAVLPATEGGKSWEQSLLLAARPKKPAIIFDQLSSIFPGVNESVRRYKGYKLVALEYEQQRFSYLLLHGLLLFSRNENLLEQCVEVYLQDRPALASSAAFLEQRQSSRRIERFLYCNIAKSREYLLQVSNNLPGRGGRLLRDQLQKMVGFSSFGYFSWGTPLLREGRWQLHFSQNAVVDKAKSKLMVAPIHNSSASLIPEDILSYYWTNSVDLSALWQAYATGNHAVPELAIAQQNFKKITDVEMLDFLKNISSEIAFFLSKGEAQQIIPWPNTLWLFKVNDIEQVRDVIERSAKFFAIPLRSDSYKGSSYRYWGIALQDDLQPVYCLYKNYLLLANSPEILYHFLDTVESGRDLMGSSQFAKIDLGMDEKNNAVTYLRVDHAAAEAKRVLRWLALLARLEDPAFAQRVDATVTHLLFPLLDGFAMYEGSFSRSYFAPESITIESRTIVGSENL